jgi:fatty acid amide hydrolase
MEMRSIWSDAFREAGIDAILHPALPLPAMPHGLSGNLTSAFSYMFLANMLLWPAGVVPVTLVQPDEQQYPMQDLPPNQQDYLAALAEKVMQDSAGLPMSVAVMTPAFQDEKCLRVMKEVERAVGFSAEPTAYKQ